MSNTKIDIRQALYRPTPNMIGNAANQDVDVLLGNIDTETGKLFEDRNAMLSDGGLIAFTGTAITFTQTLNLVLNQRTTSSTNPVVISLGSSSQSLNNGDTWIATVNRSGGTAVTSIVLSGTALPQVDFANQEVFVIARRIDSADGTKTVYFRNGMSLTSGASARLGAAGGGSGSGGAKNYLSSVITSQSSTPNTGNGNFESGNTTGWSLCNSALTSLFPSTVGTAGNAFSSAGGVHGGSAASGNLTLSTVSSGQLSGNYSASYASSTNTTPGDMLISNAFFIDTEDQAKVMQIKFYFKLAVDPGSSNRNFSGTSSNSFGMAIYDVTNAAWIMPAGVWNLVQSNGVGYCTGTFQTTSNSTQYQLAVFNANATGGSTAVTMYLDDFFVGPQIAPMAPAISDWKDITSQVTFNNFGNGTGIFRYRRVGDSAEINWNFNVGTVLPSGTLSITTPSFLSIDQIKFGGDFGGVLGLCSLRINGGNGEWLGDMNVNESAPNTLLLYGGQGQASWTGTVPATPTASIGQYQGWAQFPVAGWGSNSAASADTDTRVVAAKYTACSTPFPKNATTIAIFPSSEYDTHAAYNPSTGVYTVPVTGKYRISSSFGSNNTVTSTVADACNVSLFKNGSQVNVFSNFEFQTTSAITPFLNGSDTIDCKAGDTLDIRVFNTNNVSGTWTPSGSANQWVAFERISGPAVITATESVNCRYYNAAGPGSFTITPLIIQFSAKDYDTHNAFNNSTSLYTAPVTGKYEIKATIVGTDSTAGDTINLAIYKNGSQYSGMNTIAAFPATNMNVFVSDQLNLNAGDTISFYGSTGGHTFAITSSNSQTYFDISRIGN